MESLPELNIEVCKLKFIPITERSIEAPHGIGYRAGHMRRNSPLTVTLALKGPQAEEVMADA